MPGTTLAATAPTLTAVLAACGTDDRPEANRPETTESARTDDPSVTETATSTDARPLTYSDDYAADHFPDIHWLIQSIQYGDRVLHPRTGADIDGDGEGDGPVVYGHGGFDTTGRRLNLRLPAGYTPAENPYALFQWLDDDRFAVMAGATYDFGLSGWSGYGDILVCDIARESCTLAVPGPPGESVGEDRFHFRLVPHLTLPN